jgi:UDP-N-acetylglucosamine--N-acetylmuramyl-(pentapeptide) pyrophosphoryl-undecaprenol N-acetylglucosamine transferase
MNESQATIVIATGGSGGHVIPSEALAENLQKLGARVYFLGHQISINPYLNQHLDIQKLDIEASTLVFKKPHVFFLKNLKGIWQALKELKRIKPGCVVGFGSYHSFPILLAAIFLNIPIALYEANTQMGKVIRLFAKKAKILASPFDIHQHVPHFEKVNPLIRDEHAVCYKKKDLDYFGLQSDKVTILVFGGSQGAKVFNEELLQKIVLELNPKEYQIIHIAGKKCHLDILKKTYQKHGFLSCVSDFEHNMHKAYGSADLVISRSGATTLFEVHRHNKPVLLIPYAFSKDNHQLQNASYFLKFHPGAVIEESLLKQVSLEPLIQRLSKLDPITYTGDMFINNNEFAQRVMTLC